MKRLKIYVAGKVSSESVFKTHDWRDGFIGQLEELSGMKFINIDPVKEEKGITGAKAIFDKDCRLINQSDCLVAYLTDDISVGASQEILIAKYLKKPVIALAPKGGKFNGRTRHMLGKTVKNYKDPFVFSTCDVVCGSVEEVAEALKTILDITPKTLSIIDEAIK